VSRLPHFSTEESAEKEEIGGKTVESSKGVLEIKSVLEIYRDERNVSRAGSFEANERVAGPERSLDQYPATGPREGSEK